MKSERLLFVIEIAALHFGDGSVAQSALRILAYELRNEIKKEQSYAQSNALSDREIAPLGTEAT